jgi:hypothetical protein
MYCVGSLLHLLSDGCVCTCRTALTTACTSAAVTRKPPPELLVSRLMGEEQYRITIKPERLFEPYVERGMVGGRCLTLMVIHIHELTHVF